MKLLSHCLRGLRSSEGTTGAGSASKLTHVVLGSSGFLLVVEDLSSSWHGPFHRLPECPHVTAPGFPQSEWWENPTTEASILQSWSPPLRSDRPSLLQHSGGDTDQSWYDVGGDYTRVRMPGHGISEGHLGGWLPRVLHWYMYTLQVRQTHTFTHMCVHVCVYLR